jgi:hypothetical protein
MPMGGKRNDMAGEGETWRSPFEALFSREAGPANGDSTEDATQVLRAAARAASEITRPDPTIGTPQADIATWDGIQAHADSYGIRCQEFILEQFTGVELSQEALVQEAIDEGLYTPGEGTRPEDLGRLLELHGIGVHRYVEANQWQLAKELAEGHKVMVGIDAGELWGADSIIEVILEKLGFQLSEADHAVIVSGIDTSDPDNVKVLVSDPGTGEPVASYPIEQFIDAWKDSEFYMVATQDAAPAHLPEMANFPYEQGYLNLMADVTYEDLLNLQFAPDVWGDLIASHAESAGPLADDSDGPAPLDHVYDWDTGMEDDLDHSMQLEPPQWKSLHADLDPGPFGHRTFEEAPEADTDEG